MVMINLTQESQEVSPFQAGDHKAAQNNKDKRETYQKDPQKKPRLEAVSKKNTG